MTDYFDVVRTIKMLQNLDPRRNPIPDGDEEFIIKHVKLRVTVVDALLSCLSRRSAVPVNPIKDYAKEIATLLKDGEIEDTE